MQWNPPPPVDRQISRVVPQSSNRNHVTELALQDYSAIGQQVTTSIPQFSNYCYYGELKPQAGYLRPEIGWSQQEHFQYHHPPSHHLDMPVITEREIEKEQHIREDIIRSDIARRHVLEAEVRRVLMMERESVPERGSNGYPSSSLRTLLFESLMRLPCSVTRVEERRVLVDMIAKLLEERERLNRMCETGRLDTLPFQGGTSYLKISEVKSAVHEENKEKIILLPKPDDNASGSKREAERLDAFIKKKAKVEWSCVVCKFSASSERQLNEHLQGRKHKNEESKMQRAQKVSKNYRTDLSSRKATKCTSAPESLAFGETRVAGLKKDHLPSLQISLNSHSWKKNDSKSDPNIRMGEKRMKKRRRAHKRSKKRTNRLHVVEQNRGAGQRMVPAMIKEPQQW